MNTANDKYGSSLDRTLGAGKPVDPATRLSELLAQSLEELTRPFDPPKSGAAPSAPPVRVVGEGGHAEASADAHAPLPEPTPEESRIDADKALAELEAELFAAAKQVDRDQSTEAGEPPADHPEGADGHPVMVHAGDAPSVAARAPNEADIAAPPPAVEEPQPTVDADAASVIAKVRKLMLVSMGVTVLAVGSVFGFIGYRMMKGEGAAAKTADKVPAASAIPADITLSIPRGSRVIQSAVAADRLVITLEIDGKIEVRTFDVKTLQPAGRLNFSGMP